MFSAFFRQIQYLIAISKSHDIARRYFVVNGFDGALTTLGLLVGFYLSNSASIHIVITACLSAAIALGMSGFSSAYVSEAAERKREFRELQSAMISDLSGSPHAKASIWMPLLIAITNGLSPLIFSMIIIIPLLLSQFGYIIPFNPYEAGIGIAFFLIFLLGVFLGSVSGTFWVIAGLQTLSIAMITTILIYLIS
jgi:predicted membrane protein (TIGR00267 family)